MAGKNYRWQALWTVDHETGIATHESGIRVDIRAARFTDDCADAVDQLRAKNGGHNAPIMLARLLREALAVASVDRARDARL